MKVILTKRILIFLLLLINFTSFYAIEPKSLVNEGNELYKNGMYSQAASKYQMVVDSGFVSAELFYNLGNAYFKANDNKRAILYYEKAKLLNPQDQDLNYNLSLARSKAVDKIQNIPDLFFMEWVRNFRDQFAVDSWTIFSIALFIIGLGGLLFYFFSLNIRVKKINFWLGSAAIFLSLVSLSFAASAQSSQVKQRNAIIFVKGVTVKSTPSETGTNLFILHDGTKVKVIDKVDTWNKIKIPDGNQGWVKESDIVKI